jgi:hypothetical protein
MILLRMIFLVTLMTEVSLGAVTLMSAKTRDLNGNGYLDAIDVMFNGAVSFPADYNFHNIIVCYKVGSKTICFPVTNPIPADGMANPAFRLRIQENTYVLPDESQTDWTPTLILSNLPGVDPVSLTATDGAGPVIWKVRKEVNSMEHTQDKVFVTFSEDVLCETGTPVKMTDAPSDLFHVWSGAPIVSVDSMLTGIRILGSASRREVMFNMLNDENLNSTHSLSIENQDGAPLLFDVHQNPASGSNHCVPVLVNGFYGKLTIAPTVINSIQKNFYDVLQAGEAFLYSLMAANEGGVVFSIDLTFPAESLKISGDLQIIDFTGEVVYRRSNKNIVVPNDWDGTWAGGETTQLAFYWNGVNDDGRKVIGGEYTVKLSISFNGDKREYSGAFYAVSALGANSKTKRIGTCGAGWGLALVPLFGLQISALLRRRDPYIST